jgi:hypothetical protein
MMLCHLHTREGALSRQGTNLIDAPPVEPEASVLSFNQAVRSGFYDWAALGWGVKEPDGDTTNPRGCAL